MIWHWIMSPHQSRSSKASTGEMAKRYGFIFVEKYDDGTGSLARRKKMSFDWYKRVIESNGEEL